MKKDFLMNVVRLQGIKNALTGDAKDFADAVLSAFQSMADDDAEHGVDELTAKVEEIAGEYVSKQDVENKIAEVRESILRMVRANGAGEQSKLTPEIAKQVANAILRSRSHAEVFAALDGVIAKNELRRLPKGSTVSWTRRTQIRSQSSGTKPSKRVSPKTCKHSLSMESLLSAKRCTRCSVSQTAI